MYIEQIWNELTNLADLKSKFDLGQTLERKGTRIETDII